MSGFNIAEQAHVVQMIAPYDIDGTGARTSAVLSMKNYSHASILILLGVTGAAATVTLLACDNFTPSTTQAIAFDYYPMTTAAGDVAAAKVAATSAGFVTSLNDGVFYQIEIEAAALPSGYPCLQIATTDPAAATIGCVVAILSGSRFQSAQSAAAIA